MKLKSVPWDEVIDLMDVLFDWIQKDQKIDRALARKHPQVHFAKEILASFGDEDSLRVGVARALIDVTSYHEAGLRKETASANKKGLPREVVDLLYNDTIERSAEKKIRKLTLSLPAIRDYVERIGERNEKRIAMSTRTQEEKDRQLAANAKARALLVKLTDIMLPVAEPLRDVFHGFNQARTEFPLTQTGWRQLQSRVHRELDRQCFPWPKGFEPLPRPRKAPARRARRKRATRSSGPAPVSGGTP